MTTHTACLEAALFYLELGWSPIPLCPSDCDGKKYHRTPHHPDRAGKVPVVAWTRYATVRPTELEVRDWWDRHRGSNVGICLGGRTGLVAVDVDDAEGEAELVAAMGGEPPPTLEFVTGGGGRRLIYAWTRQEPIPTKHFPTAGKLLSFLGTGGQTVMPPSRHLSGKLYQFPANGRPGEVPVAPFPSRLYLAMTAERQPRNKLPGGGVIIPQPAKVVIQADWQVRAKAYCDRCEPAVSGQGGHVQTLKVATGLIRTCGLDESQTYEALQAYYNPRCEPPWSSAELKHKVDEAWRIWGGLVVATDDNIIVNAMAERAERLAVSKAPDPVVPTPPPPPPPPPVMPLGPKPSIPKPSTNGYHATSTSTPPPSPPARPGKLASQYTQTEVRWFQKPWIPCGMLSLVVGYPNAGKSTFLAYLMSGANRTVLLPGFEEAFEVLTLPRLKASGVDLASVLVLQQGDWSMPARRVALTQVVKDHGADLVIFDPFSSYLESGQSENDPTFIRSALEAAATIATETGAAVVGVRHPGKDTNNVMAGSREWRAVPRSIVELLYYRGPPECRYIQLHKDSLGTRAGPRTFRIEGPDQGAGRFVIAEEADGNLVDSVKEVSDSLTRSKVERAVELLQHILANGEMTSKEVYYWGDQEKLGDAVMDRAATRLNVMRRREGVGKEHKSFWSLPPVLPCDPVQPAHSPQEGGYQGQGCGE